MKSSQQKPLDLGRLPMPLPEYDQGFVDGYLAARGFELGSDVESLTALEVLDHLRDSSLRGTPASTDAGRMASAAQWVTLQEDRIMAHDPAQHTQPRSPAEKGTPSSPSHDETHDDEMDDDKAAKALKKIEEVRSKLEPRG